MRIVVSDSSCLIDLRKASLLDAFLQLPYEIVIPNTLFHDELLKFTSGEKQSLVRGGLKVVDIPGSGVLRAREIMRETPRLSIHDGFAFALAESHHGCILVTGDAQLRLVATKHGIEVHGLLWIVEEIHNKGLRTASVLLTALRALEQDATVRLPRRELLAAIRRYDDNTQT
jgi:predicted nucleic acid-binding protein